MNIEWLKNKTKEKFYPITHAKAVLFGENNKTVNDELTTLAEDVTEVNNLLNGKANSSHSHGAYELPVGSIFLSYRKVAPSYGNWEYLGTIQNLFSDLPLIQSIGEGYVYNRTS